MEDFIKHTKNDDDNKWERERLSGQHDVMMAAMGNPIYAPLDLSKPGLRILDSGTADGCWLLHMRNLYPVKHEYVGTDIDEALYPHPAPEGTRFQNQSIHDAFPTNWAESFDLVHQRLVMAAAPPQTIAAVVSRLAGLLKPGAWMQLVEVDIDSVPENGPALKQFLHFAQSMSSFSGMGPNLAKELAGAMRDAGLAGVEERSVDILHGKSNPNPELKQKSTESLCGAVPPLVQGVKSESLRACGRVYVADFDSSDASQRVY